jgi:plasmid stabilization system protein ParE
MGTISLRWTPTALTQLEGIRRRIPADGTEQAGEFIESVRDAATLLLLFPRAGRPGRVRGTRTLVIAGTPYILVYAIVRDTVAILAILCGAQGHPRSRGRC